MTAEQKSPNNLHMTAKQQHHVHIICIVYAYHMHIVCILYAHMQHNIYAYVHMHMHMIAYYDIVL